MRIDRPKPDDSYREGNSVAAKVIMDHMATYGEGSGLVNWARLFLSRHEPSV